MQADDQSLWTESEDSDYSQISKLDQNETI